MQKLLIVDNQDSFTYNLVQIVAQSRLCDFDVTPIEKIDLNKVEAYNKILLSPGPGLPSELPQLIKLIKKYAASKNILGICLGHQAIGEAFECQLKQADKILHGAHSAIRILKPACPIFKNIPDRFIAGRYHSWIIDRNNISKHIEVIAEDEEQTIMGIKHKTYKLYGLQFHPESIMTEYGKEMINNWLSTEH